VEAIILQKEEGGMVGGGWKVQLGRRIQKGDHTRTREREKVREGERESGSRSKGERVKGRVRVQRGAKERGVRGGEQK
jgi:hypothetical protein